MGLSSNRNKLLINLSFILIGIIYTLIFMHNFMSVSGTYDITFHLSRIKGLASIFQSPINFKTFSSFGEGVNLFYPYLTLLPAALIYKLTNNLILSYIFFMFIINITTLFISFYCGQGFFRRNTSSYLFAIIYLFMLYRTTDLFFRSALAEGISFTFLPIILLSVYQILFRRKYNWQLLTIGMSLIIYTHILSALMSCGLIVLLILICFFLKVKLDLRMIIITFLKAMISTILITAAFLVPMVQEFMNQRINRPHVVLLDPQALDVGKTFMEALNNNIAYFGIGMLGLISLLAPLFIKHKSLKVKVVWGLAAFLFYFSTDLFPWKLFQNTIVNIIQFPWRFLSLQAFFAAVLLALLFDERQTDFISPRPIIAMVGCLFILTGASSINLRQYLPNDPLYVTVNKDNIESVILRPVREYDFDYAPYKVLSIKEKQTNHLFKLNRKWQKHTFHTTNAQFMTTVSTKKKMEVTLPVFRYKGSLAKINNRLVSVHADQHGLVQLRLSPGKNNITVGYQYTILAKIAIFISLAYCVIFIFCLKKSFRILKEK